MNYNNLEEIVQINNNIVMIMCPPYLEYKEDPKNQSASELRDCPKCKNQMWLSKKKKGVLMFASLIGKDIILACYHCVTKMVEKDPTIITGSKKVDL